MASTGESPCRSGSGLAKHPEGAPVASSKSPSRRKAPPKKTVAVVPAGGAGRRMGTGQAKQYLHLKGRPVLAHTLAVLQQSSVIDEIILVVPETDLSRVRKDIVDAYAITKVSKILAGGRERQDSVMNGLAAVGEDCRVVVVHDGVRPFPPASLIRQVVAQARQGKAAIAGVPAKDTVKRADRNGMVLETLDRRELWLIQTPQAFPAALLKEAYRRAYAEGISGTDDASLVERAGCPVVIVPGDYGNIKITTREDLAAAEHLSAQTRPRRKRS
jgi:2-C-methyl-D-erythritol 4-phosphate cytidylyltransferase